MKVKNCILCNNPILIKILDLGNIPLPNNLPLSSDSKDICYPLNVVICEFCGLVQLGDIVDPREMFSHYTYIPSTSQNLITHFSNMAMDVVSALGLENSNKRIVDIGSNDGLLLSKFKQYGLQILGIDPAENIAPLAYKNGVETKIAFFNEEIGLDFFQYADVITATNCLAHQSNLQSFLAGIDAMLTIDGVFIAEFPYLLDMLEKTSFDTIYHEHQSYFSLRPLYDYFPKYGLHIFKVEKVSVHGGSLRIWADRGNHAIDNSIDEILSDEATMKMSYASTFSNMQIKVDTIKDLLILQLKDLNNVYGIAASAKASILLNYCGIDNDLITAVADSNVLKQGRCIPNKMNPNNRIPIISEEDLANVRVDHLVVLAWNMMDDMIAKANKFCPNAKLIVPIN